jgi:hypothetical protein
MSLAMEINLLLDWAASTEEEGTMKTNPTRLAFDPLVLDVSDIDEPFESTRDPYGGLIVDDRDWEPVPDHITIPAPADDVFHRDTVRIAAVRLDELLEETRR